MKFAHTSDWHIGYAQYNLEDRFNDFFIAAFSIAKEIVEQVKPDFVIHTGDIFHHSKPSPGAIRQATKVLELFKNAGIPFFIIRGNHDAKTSKELSFGGTALRLLSDLGLIRYLNDETVHLEELETSITGVGHYFGELAQKKVRETVSKTEYPPSNFKILAVHNFIEGQLDDVSETISTGLIHDLGFNYVAAGHYHIPWVKERINVWVPGSSEATSANDWRREDIVNGNASIYSTYYVVTAEKNHEGWKKEVESRKVLVRPKISLEIATSSENASEVQSLIETQIQNAIRELVSHVTEHHAGFLKRFPNYEKRLKKPIVRVRLANELRSDEFSLLDFQKIKEQFDLLKLDVINQQEDEETYVPSETLSALHVDEIIKSLSEEVGGKELYPLVQFAIDHFRDRPTSREFSDKEIEAFITLANELEEDPVEEKANEQETETEELKEESKNEPSDRLTPSTPNTDPAPSNEKEVEQVSSTLEDWLS